MAQELEAAQREIEQLKKYGVSKRAFEAGTAQITHRAEAAEAEVARLTAVMDARDNQIGSLLRERDKAVAKLAAADGVIAAARDLANRWEWVRHSSEAPGCKHCGGHGDSTWSNPIR